MLSRLFPFEGLNDTPQYTYCTFGLPAIHRWALGLLSPLGCGENAAPSVGGTNPWKTLLPAPHGLYPEVEWQPHTLMLHLNFSGAAKLFSSFFFF